MKPVKGEVVTATNVKQLKSLLWCEGVTVIYHEGNLLVDRETNDEVDMMGKAAWDAYKDKRVLLFQKRISRDVCRYIARVI